MFPAAPSVHDECSYPYAAGSDLNVQCIGMGNTQDLLSRARIPLDS